MTNRSYAVVGTGALGGFYGARLQQADLDVHFLLRSDYDHVAEHGLKIESKDGDFTLPRVRAYRAPGDMPACDVVIISLKTVRNHLLPELLPPLLGAHTTVLALQNGLGIEEAIAQVAPANPIVGGLCFTCSHKVGPGHVCHLDYGQVTLAQYTTTGLPAGITAGMRQIAADFEQAGVPIILHEDLVTARWRKLVWNVPFNGLTVVLNATTNQIVTDPHGRGLAEGLMREVQAGAGAHGREIPDAFIQEMMEATEKMTPYRPSMKIDYDTGRPMEVEAIFGNPLRAAQQAGVTLIWLDVLYRQLRFLDAVNRAGITQ